MNKLWYIYPIYYKEWTTDTFKNMDKFPNNYTEQKSQMKKNMYFLSLFI